MLSTGLLLCQHAIVRFWHLHSSVSRHCVITYANVVQFPESASILAHKLVFLQRISRHPSRLLSRGQATTMLSYYDRSQCLEKSARGSVYALEIILQFEIQAIVPASETLFSQRGDHIMITCKMFQPGTSLTSAFMRTGVTSASKWQSDTLRTASVQYLVWSLQSDCRKSRTIFVPRWKLLRVVPGL